MCGIAGIIRLDGQAPDPTQLDRLTDALAHRGPEGRGTFIKGGVGFGHRRLKIVDLSDAAKQPMLSQDGHIAVTFNGEIYNFRELRNALTLRGHRFTSTGDTEVLLRLYEEEGAAFLQKLRGMFALAIYDGRRGTVLLARDRLGKKPLKYFIHGKTLVFASELKALRTHPDCPKAMDGEAVHHFLSMMYVPSPQTGIAGIRKLPAAHVLSIDLASGETGLRRYWALQYRSETGRSVAEWNERVHTVFDDSVRFRMEADVPVGAFLSGGVDSAAVVAAMSRLSTRPVETFSIGSQQESHNELPLAELVAKKFGTNHHPIVVEPDIVHLLPELVATYEEPYADPSVIPTYLIARETKKVVTVALNGDGGDENFAGYARYPILKFSRIWSSVPLVHAPMRFFLARLHRVLRTTLTYRMQRFERSMKRPLAERHLQYLSFFTEEEKRELMKGSVPYPDTFAWYAERTKEARGRASHWLNQELSADLETYLADDLLPKVDLGTMAHALEARSPLLDHVLLELTATMPADLKLKGYTPKWFFKQMLRGVIPDAILDRPKTGFRLPLDHWFRGPLKPLVVDRLLSPSSPLHRIFDRGLLEAYLARYFGSRTDLSDHVWALLWLDEWMRQYT
jgi:asparagine synthase (glutamine-hydrolysing)